MIVSISCREVGVDCPFAAVGETGETAVESFMRHVVAAHSDEWFEVEVIYQAACAVVRGKAA